MKLFKKIALAASLLAAAAVMTSCNFGKDDFFGTWNAAYYASAKADAPYVNVSMYFDGRSENLVKIGGAKFWQYKTRQTEAQIAKNGTETPSNTVETFWYGTYKLSDNSNYTEGKLTLRYMYGIEISKLKSGITVEDLAAVVLDDDEALTKINTAYGTTWEKGDEAIAGIANQIGDSSNIKMTPNSKGKLVCTDVETFSFSLSGASFLGYTEMSATEINTYNELTDKTEEGCSWEVKSRSFTTVDVFRSNIEAAKEIRSSYKEDYLKPDTSDAKSVAASRAAIH